MKKMRRICATAILAVTMMGMTTVYAAGITSTLSSDAKKVTSTCNSGGSGYHVVTVDGYEVHSNQEIAAHHYQKNSTYTGGGTFTVSHSSDDGFTFRLNYNGTLLQATLKLGGTQIGKVNVTY